MKFTFLILNITLSVFIFSQGKPKQTIDKIVAQIGDNVILKSEIEAQKMQALKEGVSLTPETDCSILEQLMFQNLLLNQAEIDSLVVSDAQVDAEMENRIRVIENQIGGREKMEAFYGKSITDIKNEFRPLIKKRLLAEDMERTITANISTTPKEIEQFFSTIPKDSIPLISSKLSFQQIVLFPEITKADKDLAWKRLEDIRNDILKGKSFETQARIHSQDPGSAAQGGKLEATRGMMVPQFEATVFSIKEGDISQVFETDFGYHIIQLIERRGDDYTCRHILIAPEFNRESLALASEKIEEAYKSLKENTITWDNAVVKYSNDENTKQNRGIITNPITGEQTWSMEDLNQVDQQIYLLTDALGKGDISKPSFYFDMNERKQGIRIVRLMNRTEPHIANLNDDYALIQKAAENKKKETTINKWIDSKVSNAYIRIDKEFSCVFKNKWITTP
ncbi:MAG: peptidylprolyl isomerase [Bacteroidota bacterium]